MAKRKRADDDRLLFLEEIKRTCIIGIFSDDFLLEKLVLKGGNLIDMVFNISSRASLDIDLSMTGEFADSLDKLKLRLENSLGHAFAEIGLVVF